MYIYTCIYIYMHGCIYVCVYIYTDMYTCTCKHVFIWRGYQQIEIGTSTLKMTRFITDFNTSADRVLSLAANFRCSAPVASAAHALG